MENCIFLHEKNLIWKIKFSDLKLEKLFEAEFFKINQNGNAIFCNANKIYTYDFIKNKQHFLFDIDNIRLIDISEKIYLFINNNILYVFTIENNLIEKIEDVQYAKCYGENYAYIKNSILFCCIKGKIMQKLENILEFELSNNILVVHNSKNQISIFKGECILHKWELEKVVGCKFKIFNEELIVAEIIPSYTEGRYYGDKILYIYNIDDDKANKIRKLPMIHDVKYFDKKLYICHGNQPAAVDIYAKKLNFLCRHSIGSRNLLVLNKSYDLFAGFGNLSGMVEIYDKNKNVISQIKKLGVSSAIWSPCNTYFVLATLNDMQVDNGIIIYDFYGNKILEKSFENLRNIFISGINLDLKKIKKPEKLNLLQKRNTFTFKRI